MNIFGPFPSGGFVSGLEAARKANWDDLQQAQTLRHNTVVANVDEATQDPLIRSRNAMYNYDANRYNRNDQYEAAIQNSKIASDDARNWLAAGNATRSNAIGNAQFGGDLAGAQYNSDLTMAQTRRARELGLPEQQIGSWLGTQFAESATAQNDARNKALAGLTDSDVLSLTNPNTFNNDPRAATEIYAQRGIINPNNQTIGFEYNQNGQTIPVIYTFGSNGQVVDRRAAADHIIQGRQAGIIAATPPSVLAQQARLAAKNGVAADANDNWILNGGVPAATGQTGGTTPTIPLVTSSTDATTVQPAVQPNQQLGSMAGPVPNQRAVSQMVQPAGTVSSGSYFIQDRQGLPSESVNSVSGKSTFVPIGGYSDGSIPSGIQSYVPAPQPNITQAPVQAPAPQPNITQAPAPQLVPTQVVYGKPSNGSRLVEIVRHDGTSTYVPEGSVINQNGDIAARSGGYYQQTDERSPEYFTQGSNATLPNQPNADVHLVYTPYAGNSEPTYNYTPEEFRKSVIDSDNAITGGRYRTPGVGYLPQSGLTTGQQGSSQLGTPSTQDSTPASGKMPTEFAWLRNEYLRDAQLNPIDNDIAARLLRSPYVAGYTEQLGADIMKQATESAIRKSSDAIANRPWWQLWETDPEAERVRVQDGLARLQNGINAAIIKGQLSTVLPNGATSDSDINTINRLIDNYGADNVKRFRPDLIRYIQSREFENRLRNGY